MGKVYTTKQAIEILQAFDEGKTIRWSIKNFTRWSKVSKIGEFNHQWDFKNYDYKIEKTEEK